ncbi:MAG: HyaD/HybD family hydrogenase maturation endopeptidase [Sterolibacteriaceae bacterium MAG5]|nr:HyaD/HybD family hydrogenase maturation endopeptidase [Candidatus Nitricoxidireducens bremensis]
MRAVVLGIGNTILTDEGVGVRAVEALQQRYALPENVEPVDGGTAGMELIEALSGLDLLVVLDTIVAGKAPGTVISLAGDDIPVFFRKKLSPHQIGLSDVLASLELLGELPKETLVFGVQPVSLELGTELTPTVAEKVPELAELAAGALRQRGYVLEPLAVEVA